MKLKTHIKTILADTLTPVSIYLALRDKYPSAVLLESSDYNKKDEHFSYIALDPIASFTLSKGILTIKDKGKILKSEIGYSHEKLEEAFAGFKDQFTVENSDLPFCTAALFGYTAFDIIKYTEHESLSTKPKENDIPELCYKFYTLVLIFDHRSSSLHIISHSDNQEINLKRISKVEKEIFGPIIDFPFETCGKEEADLSDGEFKILVQKAKYHCSIGDVFQLVLSRRFRMKFFGDEFNVYRALKNINPSPYLFYFDMGDFRLFGSSPEAQIKINNGKASIHPIAGTYKRTANDEDDLQKALDLKNDKKENAEHVMLVDLARNDLSKYCKEVEVAAFKQVQLFSHVIHLVSEVKGKLRNKNQDLGALLGTFPMGTLSGAPKYKALQLINDYEGSTREFYGGCVGFIGLNGQVNHAIMIRTFMSRNNALYYRAGAGIVIDSDKEKESQEINNKLEALRKAIVNASKFNNIAEGNNEPVTADNLETTQL